MTKNFLVLLFLILSIFAFGQMAPNFDLVDSGGNHQRLYEDYLNQGKVVMLKIFFVNCPPCNAIAAEVQQKYVQWGSGTGDVQFIEISNKVTDNNTLINNYKSQHGITFPSIGSDGGGYNATQPYMSNMFGQWYGTPTLIVIAPNGSVNFDVDLNDLNSAIQAAIPSTAPTDITVIPSFVGGNLPAGVSVMMHPSAETTPMLNLTELTNGSYQFQYPSANFPSMENPVIELKSTAPAKSTLLNIADLVAIKKHILGLPKFTTEEEKTSADVNGDGKINVLDLVALQKVIVGVTNVFPNNRPSYILFPEIIPVNIPSNGGGEVNLDLTILKVGNVK